MKQPIRDISEITYSVEMLEKKPPRFISIFVSVLLLLLGTTFCWLLFSKVDITVKGSVIVEPGKESIPVVSEISSVIDKSYIQDGMKVEKGDILLELAAQSNEINEIAYIKEEIKELETKQNSFKSVYEAISSNNFEGIDIIDTMAEELLTSHKEQVNQNKNEILEPKVRIRINKINVIIGNK
ncbi:hypothetical protein [Bacillus coahuilensis]|uniref:hypothetical protein n=1 Tax=Bacillus coahuilensis TaxID=408580 RepID=UPI0001850FDB|nr:hypothetical protein [Bacillus coahuilensis]